MDNSISDTLKVIGKPAYSNLPRRESGGRLPPCEGERLAVGGRRTGWTQGGSTSSASLRVATPLPAHIRPGVNLSLSCRSTRRTRRPGPCTGSKSLSWLRAPSGSTASASPPILGFTDVHRWCYDSACFLRVEPQKHRNPVPTLRSKGRGFTLGVHAESGEVCVETSSASHGQQMIAPSCKSKPPEATPGVSGCHEQRTYDHVSPGSVSQSVKLRWTRHRWSVASAPSRASRTGSTSHHGRR